MLDEAVHLKVHACVHSDHPSTCRSATPDSHKAEAIDLDRQLFPQTLFRGPGYWPYTAIRGAARAGAYHMRRTPYWPLAGWWSRSMDSRPLWTRLHRTSARASRGGARATTPAEADGLAARLY